MKNKFKIINYIYERGFFHLLSVNFLTQFLGFGSSLLVTKFLTPVEFGEVKILQSYIMVFIVLGGFGINAAILKVCSENRTNSEKEYILRIGVGSSLVSVCVTFIIIAFLAYKGIITSSKHLSFWLVIYSLAIPFAIFTDIFISYLQALKKIKEIARAQILIRIQSFIFIIISVWLWGFKGFIFATIVAYIAGLVPLLFQVRLDFLYASIGKLPKKFFNLAFFCVLANGVGVLGKYVDILILDHYTSNRVEIGYYSLATIFILGVSQVTSTVQSIIVPYISEKCDDIVWLRRQIIINQIRMATLSIFVALAVYVLAWIFVPIIYGAAYKSSLIYLAVLLLKYIFWSSYAVIGIAILGMGLVKTNLIIGAISTLISIVLSYFLLKSNGIIGVSWAQVYVALITLGIYLWTIKRILKIPLHNKNFKTID